MPKRRKPKLQTVPRVDPLMEAIQRKVITILMAKAIGVPPTALTDQQSLQLARQMKEQRDAWQEHQNKQADN